MVQLRHFLFPLAALSGVLSNSLGHFDHIHVVNKEIAPDGYSRLATLAEGVFPAPIIRATKGDHFRLKVIDQLTNENLDRATSIHWHGLFQHATNFADGVSFVTQCPIVPQEEYLYHFTPKDQAGTFWYHSHYRNQYCDGLRGALVIQDPEDPHKHLYDVDNDDTVITLADWYHYLSMNYTGTPLFNSTLINGKGRYYGGPNVTLAVVNVKQGLRYRFRLVSISCDPNFTFSIDGHNMTVIEVEGTNVQPLVVDSIQIFAGQRYSFVLHANQPVDNYWLRSLPPNGNYSDYMNLATLRYAGAPEVNPTVDPTVNVVRKTPLLETNLHPLNPSPVPGLPHAGGADINIRLNITHVNTSTGIGSFQVNGVSFEPPSIPVLLQILSGAQSASDLLPKGSVYGLAPNKSVELEIIGLSAGGPHPVHLHGHNFHVVRSANRSDYNFNDPVIRDVVNTGNTTEDLVTIRFFTNNPGPWFFHCHIDWHLNSGFAVVFAEDVPDVSKVDVVIRPDFGKLCPAYDDFVKKTNST